MRRIASRLIPTLILVFPLSLRAQTTQFSYQGRLSNSGSAANGNYDFQFKLFDTAATGSQLGSTLAQTSISVAAGIFTVQLDFGACATCFDGSNRFLEISVRPTGGSTYTTLAPRQQISSTPYAVRSLNSTAADGLSVACVSCVTSSQIASVNANLVTGTLPVSSVPAGSTNYIQNGSNQQASSNFNISGNGIIGGSLGVGTANPSGLVHARGASPVRFLGDPSTLQGTESVDFFARSSAFASDLGGMRIQRQNNGNIDTSSYAALNGSPAFERMRINGFGYVGIGTANPTAQLDVQSTGVAVAGQTTGTSPAIAGGSTATSGTAVSGFASGTTGVGISGSASGASGIGILGLSTGNGGYAVYGNAPDGFGVFGISNNANSAGVRGQGLTGVQGSGSALGVWGSSTSGTAIFGTTDSGSGVYGTSTSGTGVYGTSSSSTSIGVYGFSTSGVAVEGLSNANFAVAGYTTSGTGVYGDNGGNNGPGHAGYFNGRVAINGNLILNGVVFNSSDIRLKEEIAPLEYGLSELLRLQPVTWKWKSDHNGRQLGLIAQEVEHIVPELVQHDADPAKPLGLNYLALAPITIKAIQEQQARIVEQEARMATQQRQLEMMQHQIETLKTLLCTERDLGSVCQ